MIGRYPHTVIIERKKRTSDGGGGFEIEWERIGRSRARVTPLSGTEVVFGQQVQDSTTHTITLPSPANVGSADRLIFRGRVFQITSTIDNNEAGRYIVLRAEENVGVLQETTPPPEVVTYEGEPVYYEGEVVTYVEP